MESYWTVITNELKFGTSMPSFKQFAVEKKNTLPSKLQFVEIIATEY